MILLEKSGLPFPSRGNPILVSRALSKMVYKIAEHNQFKLVRFRLTKSHFGVHDMTFFGFTSHLCTYTRKFIRSFKQKKSEVKPKFNKGKKEVGKWDKDAL